MATSSDGAMLLCAAGDSVVEVAASDGAVHNRWSPGVGSASEPLTAMAVSLGACSGLGLRERSHARGVAFPNGHRGRQLMSHHISYATPPTGAL